MLKIAKNRFAIIFYSNTINFTEKLQKNCLFSSHWTLGIFSEFFINFLILHFLIFINMRKCGTKKFWILRSTPMREFYRYLSNTLYNIQLKFLYWKFASLMQNSFQLNFLHYSIFPLLWEEKEKRWTMYKKFRWKEQI